MDTGLTVACVYKPGNGFTDDYVYKMRDSLAQHSKAHNRFVCLTDQRLRDIECVPFSRRAVGWWNKLDLFRPGLFNGPVAYFDLDTMFVGDITDMLELRSSFACTTDWLGRGTTINSTMMLWDARVAAIGAIYAASTQGAEEKYSKGWQRWGDQGFIQDHLPIPFISLNQLYPGRIVSYKIHVRGIQHGRPDKVPEGASVVAFHGNPRPHKIGWTLPHG